MASSTARGGTGRGRGSSKSRRAAVSGHDAEKVELFYDLVRVIYRHVSVGPLDVWENLELTKAQLRTLVLLKEGPARMSAIATRLGISLPAATGLIDRLVAKGLVERDRDPDDRRAVVCRVARKGTKVLDRLSELGRGEFLDVVQHLTPEQLDRVIDGVAILASAIEEATEADAVAGRRTASR